MVPFLSKCPFFGVPFFFGGGGVSVSRHLFFGVPPKQDPWNLQDRFGNYIVQRAIAGCTGAEVLRGGNRPFRWGSSEFHESCNHDDEWSHCHFTRILIPLFIVLPPIEIYIDTRKCHCRHVKLNMCV